MCTEPDLSDGLQRVIDRGKGAERRAQVLQHLRQLQFGDQCRGRGSCRGPLCARHHQRVVQLAVVQVVDVEAADGARLLQRLPPVFVIDMRTSRSSAPDHASRLLCADIFGEVVYCL